MSGISAFIVTLDTLKKRKEKKKKKKKVGSRLTSLFSFYVMTVYTLVEHGYHCLPDLRQVSMRVWTEILKALLNR